MRGRRKKKRSLVIGADGSRSFVQFPTYIERAWYFGFAVTDTDGRFVTGVTLPSGPLWDNQETITIIARVDRSGPVAQAAYRIESGPAPLVDVPTVVGDQTDTPTPEPSDTPTNTVEPTLVLTVPVSTAPPATEAAPPPAATTRPRCDASSSTSRFSKPRTARLMEPPGVCSLTGTLMA